MKYLYLLLIVFVISIFSAKAQPQVVGFGNFTVGPDSAELIGLMSTIPQGYYDLYYMLHDTTNNGMVTVIDTFILGRTQTSTDIIFKNLMPGHGYLFNIIYLDSVGNDNRNFDFVTESLPSAISLLQPNAFRIFQSSSRALFVGLDEDINPAGGEGAIYDMAGKKKLAFFMTGKQQNIPLDGLSSASYLITLTTDKGVVRQKIWLNTSK